MFKVNNIQELNNTINCFELISKDKSSYAKIALNLGGSLQELIINNKQIIKSENLLDYKSNYASAILFPFVNRVKKGKYTFNKKEYSLDINMENEKSALHGLVYDKTFKKIKTHTCENKATATITYKENEKNNGFPFKYSILLTYTLTNDTLELKVIIKNEDLKPLPFNIGWHPYFFSSNLSNSYLKMKSSKKLVLDNEKIPVNLKKIDSKDFFQLKNMSFDDCFILKNDNIEFKTPEYHINLSSSSAQNFLQIFTPKNTNKIALEPMTGVANSLNHKRGLQVLKPNESYDIKWKIKLEK